ncbi:para-nitrobenzyl esterase-like [Sabethes cyaneus]|uniref:para-nitrobenzyl esterase-like n=1 Tax=Sabethes cyaneus TaxID=53552 RepID=UPI00237D7658|nr:para-nitrobenzyl esterase-like [Sabethes cyaneus]
MEAITQLAAGKVKGRKFHLPNGDPFYSYKGIPYAQPPIGALRFKPPIALEKFDDVILDCSYERNSCYSLSSCPSSVAVSEDCLYANVYTPLSPNEAGLQKNLPVMVWVHGGAFGAGSGESSMYNPRPLIQQGVIVVTFNYRLGPFGFLCLPSANIYGNMGLKDQRMLLRWVHDNISHFGGDPSNVTIFGESAGGASVHLLYLSESCKPYYHKAICQSGVAVSCWVEQQASEANAINLAKRLGCTSTSCDEVYDTLMTASGPDLLMHSDENLINWDKSGLRFYSFTPVVEPNNADDPFLTENYIDIICKPNLNTVPLMLGITSNEGMCFAPYLLQLPDLFSNDPERYVPPQLPLSNDQRYIVGEEIKRFYFGEKKVSPETISSLLEYVSDCMFVIPALVASELHSRYQHRAPQYFYRFAFKSELNFITSLVNAATDKALNIDGATHGDDLSYLFDSEFLGETELFNSDAIKFRQITIQLWTNFAKFANPTPTKEQIGCIWCPVQPIDVKQKDYPLQVLNLADPVEMVFNPFEARVDFWKQLFAKFGGNYLDHCIVK